MKIMTILGFKADTELSMVCFIKEHDNGKATLDVHKSLNTVDNLCEIVHRVGDNSTKDFADLASARKYTLGFFRRIKNTMNFSIVCAVNSSSCVSEPCHYSQFTKVVWVNDLCYDPDDLAADWFDQDAIPYSEIINQHMQKKVTQLKTTRDKKQTGGMLSALMEEEDLDPSSTNSASSLRRAPKKPEGPADLDDFLTQLESGKLVEEEVE